MGSRTLPFECEHGVTVDWGDFGPDYDSEDPDWDEEQWLREQYPVCEKCQAAQAEHRAHEEGVRRMVQDVANVRAACKDRVASVGKDKAVISCQWVLEQLGGTK